jgi:hypothetical protein
MSKMSITKADFKALIKAADKLGNNDGVADVSEIQEIRDSRVRKDGWSFGIGLNKSIATRLREKKVPPQELELILQSLEKIQRKLASQIDAGGGAMPAFKSILRQMADNDDDTNNLSQADINHKKFESQLSAFNK